MQWLMETKQQLKQLPTKTKNKTKKTTVASLLNPKMYLFIYLLLTWKKLIG